MISAYGGQYREVAQIYHRAVHETASADYSRNQIEARAPSPIDYARWQRRCEAKQPFLWCQEDQVLGFIELDPDGHIDCHYVSPDHTRSGIGGRLLDHAIAVARKRGLQRLYVEASHGARGLYQKKGFSIVRANEVEIRGVFLQNWLMELQPLAPGAP